MTPSNLADEKLFNELQAYSQRRFTGRLDVQASTTWSLYFCMGRLVWAAGGVHPLRRWHRHLKQYCTQISPERIRLRETDISRASWEYLALTVLVKRQAIAGDRAVAAIKNTFTEILFDILQHSQKEPLTFIDDPEDVLDASLTLINPTRALQEAQQTWETWCNSGLGKLSPNLAPVLLQPEALQQLVTPRAYDSLEKLIDGKHTFRELAILLKQDLLVLTRSLIPHIRKQIIGLTSVADLPLPTASPTPPTEENKEAEEVEAQQRKIDKRRRTDAKKQKQAKEVSKIPSPSPSPSLLSVTCHPSPIAPTTSVKPLVAYVEDSLHECRIMGQILSKTKYRFVTIPDSVQALPLLIQHKPDLIFLDLVMPVANGYEICTQIRRVSYFKNTPIIIVTGNDGVVDRVRAKLVGATDFLAKPIVSQKILAALPKYLDLTDSLPNYPHCLIEQAS
jgi:two-component system, chemotaxis family, response regulator PixG